MLRTLDAKSSGGQKPNKRMSTSFYFYIRSGLSSISQDDQSMIFTLKMISGEEVQSRNVILAMGAYFNISSILSPFTARDMELSLTSQTIAYIRVSPKEAEVVINKKGI